jgi:hypothetical protein
MWQAEGLRFEPDFVSVQAVRPGNSGRLASRVTFLAPCCVLISVTFLEKLNLLVPTSGGWRPGLDTFQQVGHQQCEPAARYQELALCLGDVDQLPPLFDQFAALRVRGEA